MGDHVDAADAGAAGGRARRASRASRRSWSCRRRSGPSRPKISPAFTDRSRSTTAWMPPGNVFESPVVVMTSPGAQWAPTPGDVGMSASSRGGVEAVAIVGLLDGRRERAASTRRILAHQQSLHTRSGGKPAAARASAPAACRRRSRQCVTCSAASRRAAAEMRMAWTPVSMTHVSSGTTIRRWTRPAMSESPDRRQRQERGDAGEREHGGRQVDRAPAEVAAEVQRQQQHRRDQAGVAGAGDGGVDLAAHRGDRRVAQVGRERGRDEGGDAAERDEAEADARDQRRPQPPPQPGGESQQAQAERDEGRDLQETVAAHGELADRALDRVVHRAQRLLGRHGGEEVQHADDGDAGKAGGEHSGPPAAAFGALHEVCRRHQQLRVRHEEAGIIARRCLSTGTLVGLLSPVGYACTGVSSTASATDGDP